MNKKDKKILSYLLQHIDEYDILEIMDLKFGEEWLEFRDNYYYME